MRYKSLEGIIMLGDILMSLIIFYILVLQAFIDDFRVTACETPLVISLKIIAIAFEFSKILMKSIKQEFIGGVYLTYLTDIMLYSTGIF